VTSSLFSAVSTVIGEPRQAIATRSGGQENEFAPSSGDNDADQHGGGSGFDRCSHLCSLPSLLVALEREAGVSWARGRDLYVRPTLLMAMAIYVRSRDARTRKPSEGTHMTKAQDNVTLIRKGFEAFNKGDVATLSKILAADCVQHMPGDNRFSGDHKGRDSVLKMYGELGALTNGTMQAVLGDVYATDHGAIASYTATATRNGRSLEQKTVLAFTIVDGKATDLDEIPLNGVVEDAFWA
jgi:ketosteroid isomerase-like protein